MTCRPHAPTPYVSRVDETTTAFRIPLTWSELPQWAGPRTFRAGSCIQLKVPGKDCMSRPKPRSYPKPSPQLSNRKSFP